MLAKNIESNHLTLPPNSINYEQSSALNIMDKEIKLNDGRTLNYHQYGQYNNPKSKVIIVCHSTTGNILHSYIEDTVRQHKNTCFLVPFRPGFANSTKKANQKINEWTTDLEQFLAQLNIQQFSIIAIGSGCHYALQASEHFSNSLTHITLVSPIIPDPKTQLISPSYLVNLNVADLIHKTRNDTYKKSLIFMVNGFLNNPEFYFERIKPQLCLNDQRILNKDTFWSNLKYAITLSSKKGAKRIIDDFLLALKTPVLPPETKQIETPVTLWLGQQDPLIAKKQVKELYKHLTHCDLIQLLNQGSYFIHNQWLDIINNHLLLSD